MKLFLATFLASLAVAKGQDPENRDELLDRWKLSEPTVLFDEENNIFTFTYDPLHNDNEISTMKFSFYDDKCKDDGTDDFGTEYDIESDMIDGVANPKDLLNPIDGYPMEVGGYPQWEYTGSVKALVNDPVLYQPITEENILEFAAKYPDIKTEEPDSDVGSGILRFCVRFDIGFLGANDAFVDVNFRESIVQLKFDLTVGFTVQAFNVAPKERITTTTVKDNYELLGYLCPDTTNLVDKDDRMVPVDGTATATAFNQGALISVCVIPDSPAVQDGIIISSLTDYKWVRDDVTPSINQDAIVGSAKSSNGLSLYRCETSGYYCVIESILFAEFFESSGLVSGTGNAQLAFEARRLSDADAKAVRRKLEEEDSAAEFDLSVGVNAGGDGPGAIRTAGGPSMEATVLATLGALVSAALLA